MKTLFIYIAIAFGALCSAQTISADKQLYAVNIFQWSKDGPDNKTDKIVLINADGSVTYTVTGENEDGGEEIEAETYFEGGKENYMQLDMAAVTKGFTKFIEGEKLVKIPAYGEDEMSEATEPEEGSKSIHITIVKMEDHLRDKDFQYPSEYFKLIVIPVEQSPTDLYKYLSPDLAASLKKMLD